MSWGRPGSVYSTVNSFILLGFMIVGCADGNGFKTSTMRLGADVIVFSRSRAKNGNRYKGCMTLHLMLIAKTRHCNPVLSCEFACVSLIFYFLNASFVGHVGLVDSGHSLLSNSL